MTAESFSIKKTPKIGSAWLPCTKVLGANRTETLEEVQHHLAVLATGLVFQKMKRIYGQKWVMHTFHRQSAVWVSTDASCFRFTTKNFQPVGQDCILWSKVELFNSWLEVAQNGSLGQAHEFNRGTLRTWILLKQAAEYQQGMMKGNNKTCKKMFF